VAEPAIVVVVSLEAAELLEVCLDRIGSCGHRVVVVDNAAPIDVAAIARRFDRVEVIRLPENRGYGSAANVGIRAAASSDVVLMNADAWPRGDGLERLLACASSRPRAGILGPRLVGTDETVQPTEFRFPTPWWTGRPAVTSWPERIRRRKQPRDQPRRGFVVGAVLFLRREAFEEVGGFDPDFFLFNEEADLAWRMWRAGWSVERCDDAVFVHVGGAATRRNWGPMYREQLRGHLLFLSKRHGLATAERARRFLIVAVGTRAVVARGPERRTFADAFRWLVSGPAPRLLEHRARTSPDRTARRGGRTDADAH